MTRIFSRGLIHATKSPTRFSEPLVQTYRAWPWYCDQNLHVNNAHYLTFMDYGRVIWLVRSQFFRKLRATSYRPLMAGLGITYRREIPWFSRFDLHTQAVGVEGRWIYVVQEFRQRGQVAARAMLRVGVSGPDGLIDVAKWLEIDAAELPEDVMAWAKAADLSAAAIR